MQRQAGDGRGIFSLIDERSACAWDGAGLGHMVPGHRERARQRPFNTCFPLGDIKSNHPQWPVPELALRALGSTHSEMGIHGHSWALLKLEVGSVCLGSALAEAK